MRVDDKMWIAKGDEPVYILPKMANRHGLIAGASGTGKTISLKVLAESFSDMGVPVFLADIKGDLSGMISPGVENAIIKKRVEEFPIPNWSYKAFPTTFWDIFGEQGAPIRTTVSEMGPLLLSRLLDLTEVQEGVLNVVFKVADDNKLLLIDLKDLRAMLEYCNEKRSELSASYGNITTQSIGAIQRALLSLEGQGGDIFFGEPAISLSDWITCDSDGRGMINVLYSVKLIQNPMLYATFLLWLLSSLFEELPELGDPDKPKIVFFFDEAHLLFNDMPKELTAKVIQVVKLIRSKGVGVYFCTQSPSDIPDEVLAQLSNRIQHGLRAYTPAEQTAVRAAATAFRENPNFKTEDVITELGTGEALISTLQEDGSPSIVQRAFVLPPQSHMGATDVAQIQGIIAQSPMTAKYKTAVDNESAFEDLAKKKEEDAKAAELEKEKAELEKEKAELEKEKAKQEAKEEKEREKKAEQRAKATSRFVTSTVSSIGKTVTRDIVRNILKGFKL